MAEGRSAVLGVLSAAALDLTFSPSWYCYDPLLTVRGQTKACGFWGCDWETRASTGSQSAQQNYTSLSIPQGCRAGTNRYRTEAEMDYLVFDWNGSLPALVPGPSVVVQDTKNPEYTC